MGGFGFAYASPGAACATAAPAAPVAADAGAAAGQSATAPSSAEPMIMLNRPPRMAFLLSDQAAMRRIELFLPHCPDRFVAASSPSPTTGDNPMRIPIASLAWIGE
ncbi:hypothetical protein AAH991_25860 [Microbispora sp. ZYX-F-249]|uniref:Uncharacterized protein n=1 Tax=Microbispora maris TaxID=3144104 RepID=A0ABV0AVC2_9ACTN